MGSGRRGSPAGGRTFAKLLAFLTRSVPARPFVAFHAFVCFSYREVFVQCRDISPSSLGSPPHYSRVPRPLSLSFPTTIWNKTTYKQYAHVSRIEGKFPFPRLQERSECTLLLVVHGV